MYYIKQYITGKYWIKESPFRALGCKKQKKIYIWSFNSQFLNNVHSKYNMAALDILPYTYPTQACWTLS